jgi:arginase family enzyme
VAVVGAPIDLALGIHGAAFGPRHIHADERILPNVPGLMMNPATRVKSFDVLNVVDYGDVPVEP